MGVIPVKKLHSRRGMTMAELLVVVAIIGILGGVAFLAVSRYQRTSAQLERDGIARELFVAAQNNLTAVQGEGYLGMSGFGVEGTYEGDAGNDIYYYTVNAGTVSHGAEDAFSMMLPFASIDETVRSGGSYLIRYQQSTGLVLDVFYCTLSASPDRFNHRLDVTEYGDLMANSGSENKSARRDWEDRSVIGWYGGTDAQTLASVTLSAPRIEVKNAETLSVTVTHANGASGSLRLVITGVMSGVSHYLNITDSEETVVLDDITTPGGHFAERIFDDMGITETNNGFIPGEDLKIQAVAYTNEALANIAYSEELTVNSLFESISEGADTANIGNIRHLENLDAAISGLGANDAIIGGQLAISKARQTDDLDWEDFLQATAGDEGKVYGLEDETGTEAGSFRPVSPDYILDYDGQKHAIRHLTVTGAESAGLFGSMISESQISHLELVDASVSGTQYAGALAGQLMGTAVFDVIARNSMNDRTADVTASEGAAGGLIGSLAGGSVQYAAAALTVSGETAAGGLIGEAAGEGQIASCYAGGHTENGSYYTQEEGGNTPIYNIFSEGTSGGLIGAAGDAKIRDCYTTCSVQGVTAGGFAGSASGSVEDCYCTGLVSGDGDNAFLGSGAPALSGLNQYYALINESTGTDEEGNSVFITKGPGAEGVTAADADTETYQNFIGDPGEWAPAGAYDPELVRNYEGKYPLKALGGLPEEGILFARTHYGDWPAPEILFLNTAE